MGKLLTEFQNSIWNFLLMILLLGTHIYFTVKLKFIQKRIPEGIKLSFAKEKGGQGGISPYASLATALAATIGTGNIIGISTAIAVGGPGAVFWCWITGVFGIATCYAECFLAVRYRVKKENGTYAGGAMYVLERVLHKRKAALFFALLTVAASFGIGSSVQSHAISAAVTEKIALSPHLTGIVVAMLAGSIVIGGGKKIAKVCTFLVPVMSFLYLGGCFFLMLKNASVVPKAIEVIVRAAFSSESVAGGIAGTAVMTGIRVGISKGLFTNEAGMGSIAMSAADAKTTSPVKQGIISMTGVFWDTVVMCAVTGITIVSSMLKNPESYQSIKSDRLCFQAFSFMPAGEWILIVSLVLFAFATIIGWSYYGECAAGYLFGERGIGVYQILFIVTIYLGAVMSLEMVWGMADIFNSLMAVPNILSLLLLRRVIIKETAADKR